MLVGITLKTQLDHMVTTPRRCFGISKPRRLCFDPCPLFVLSQSWLQAMPTAGVTMGQPMIGSDAEITMNNDEGWINHWWQGFTVLCFRSAMVWCLPFLLGNPTVSGPMFTGQFTCPSLPTRDCSLGGSSAEIWEIFGIDPISYREAKNDPFLVWTGFPTFCGLMILNSNFWQLLHLQINGY